MSRAFDFTVMTIVWVISFTIHYISIVLFGPDSGLHQSASSGPQVFGGAQLIDLWFEILSIWVPLMACAGITAWVVLREYRRGAITAATPR